MMLKFSKFTFFFLIAFQFAALSLAQQGLRVPEVPNPPRLVNDFGDFMSSTEQAKLESRLLALNDSTSVELTVVTVPNLEGMDIAQYGLALGNKWKVGKAGKENGIVILASKADKKMSIQTGRGIESSVTDAIAARIIRNEMRPAFQQGDFYTGFLAAADAIALASKGEYKADDPESPAGFPLVFILLIVIIAIIAIRKNGGRGGGGTYVGRHGGDLLTGAILGGLFSGGRGGSGFGGGFGGSGGGGGFGGFGGGSFGGGGASGGW